MENFKHEILFTNLNKISADCIETDLIYYYKQIGISYNIADGGEGRTREHDTLETKQRMSVSQYRRFKIVYTQVKEDTIQRKPELKCLLQNWYSSLS